MLTGLLNWGEQETDEHDKAITVIQNYANKLKLTPQDQIDYEDITQFLIKFKSTYKKSQRERPVLANMTIIEGILNKAPKQTVYP